ncbi:UPF0648 protein [Elsinoe australis]|uniref:UPF0648 protein n=1 Tax=Elsinoe australis TaxID=40998 RepID=A0A2P7YC25_9PEZI|nr:UPF0648 protein [Elsinoe australis]
MGNVSSLLKKRAPWARLQKPALVSLISFDERGLGDFMHEIAAREPAPTEVEYHAVINVLWKLRLTLPRMTVTVIDADDLELLIKAEAALQNIVRANVHRIIFLFDGMLARRDQMEDMLLCLSCRD